MLQKLIDRKVLPQAFLTTAGMPAAATASAETLASKGRQRQLTSRVPESTQQARLR